MTAQVIATPPGTTTNYDSNAVIPVENGVVYQIADVDANGNVGPVLDPASLNIEVVGDDLQVTLPDGTVLNFVGIVELWSSGGVAALVGPNGEVVVGSLEQAVAPAAGPDGGQGPGDGSSAAFNPFAAVGIRNFGEAPEGPFIGLGQPDFEFIQNPFLFLLVGDEPPEEIVDNPGRLFTPEDNRADFTTDTPAIIRTPDTNSDGPFEDPCDTHHTGIYIEAADLKGNKAFANDGGFGNFPDDLNVIDAREGEDEVWLANKGGVNEFGDLYFGKPGIQLPFFGGADNDKVYGGDDNDIIFGDGLFLGKFKPIENGSGEGSGETEGFGYDHHGFGPATGGTLQGGDDYLEGNDGRDYMVGDGLLGTGGAGMGHIGYNLLLPIIIDLAENGGWLPSYLHKFDLKDMAKVAGLDTTHGESNNIKLNLFGGDDDMYGGSGRDTMIGDGIISFCCPPSSHCGPDVVIHDYGFGNEKMRSEQHLKGGDDYMSGGSGGDKMVGDGIFLLPESFMAKCNCEDEEEEEYPEEVLAKDGLYGEYFHTFGQQTIINKAKLEGGDDYMRGGSGRDTMIGDGIVAFCCRPSLVTIPVTFYPVLKDQAPTLTEGDHFDKDTRIVTELRLKGGDDDMFGGSGRDTMVGDGIVAVCCDPVYVTVPRIPYDYELKPYYGDVKIKTEIKAKGGDDFMSGGSGGDLMIGDGLVLMPNIFERHGSGPGPQVQSVNGQENGSGPWVTIYNNEKVRLEGGDDVMFGGSGRDIMAGDGILALCCDEGIRYGETNGLHVRIEDKRETKLLGGDDLMFGGSGSDIMIGDLIVGYGAQHLYYRYGFGKDKVVMKGGDDKMFGGSGRDIMIGDGIVALSCDEGCDFVGGSGSGGWRDTGTFLIGGDDKMFGGDNRDFMIGDGILDLTGDYRTRIKGGDDFMVGGRGGDYMMGDGLYSFHAFGGFEFDVEGFDWTTGYDWSSLELGWLGEMNGDFFEFLAWADQSDGSGVRGGDDVMIGDGLHFNLAYLGHGPEGHDWEVQKGGSASGFERVRIGFDDHMWGNGGDDLMVGDGVVLTDHRRYGGGPAFNGYLSGGILLLAGDDKMFGQDGHDLMLGDGILALGLSAGSGHYDPIVVKGGDDFMVGGHGNDIMLGDGILSIGGHGHYGYGAVGIESSEGYGYGFGSGTLKLKGGDDVIFGDIPGNRGSGHDTLIGDGIIAVEFGGLPFPTLNGPGGSGGKVIVKGGNDTIFGGSGDDLILGDGLVGVKVGFGGNKIVLKGGDDKIFGGGSGPDILAGDGLIHVNVLPFIPFAGETLLDGPYVPAPKDTAEGGNDYIRGGSGGDVVIGDGLANVFVGGGLVGFDDFQAVSNLTGGDDKLYGDSGNDFMLGDGFYNLYLGGELPWFDGLSLDDADFDWSSITWKDLFEHFDVPTPWEDPAAWFGIDGLNGGNDTMSGGYGNDFVHGQSGDDTVNGDQGVDDVFGGKGNDLGFFINDWKPAPCAPLEYYDGNTDSLGWFGLNGGPDAEQGLDTNPATGEKEWSDTIQFGLNLEDFANEALMNELQDYFQFVQAGNDHQLFTISELSLQVIEWEEIEFHLIGCEDLVLTTILVGDDGFNSLSGGSGNDLIVGFGSADILTGRDGDDLIFGGNDDDEIYGDHQGSYSFSTGGNDKLFGDEGRDKIWGDAGDDIGNYGAGGDDKIWGGGSADTVFGDAGNDIFNNSTGGNDYIYGGEGRDKIYGDAGDDVRDHSTGGDDHIWGDGGRDTISGDAGDDVKDNSTGGNDHIYGGDDRDTIYGDAKDDITASSSGGDDHIYGDDDRDTIYGDAGDRISSSSSGGNDVIYGGDGNDTIYGDARRVAGTAGDDTIFGGDGNDTIYADGATVTGTSGNDSIFGGLGDDDIFLGAKGNGDQDIVFYVNTNEGTDTINGFDNVFSDGNGHDVIDLDELFDNLELTLGINLTEADRIARVILTDNGPGTDIGIDTSLVPDGAANVTLADVTNVNTSDWDIGNGANDDILVGA